MMVNRNERGSGGVMRKSVAVFLALIALLFGAIHAPAPVLGQSASPEQQLAEQYAPIAMLKSQTHACDRDGEGYFPAPVEVVLGNPDVALMQHVDGKNVLVKMGPTAQDLAGKDETYYLDFPGNPRRPGCTYESSFKQYAAAMNAQPTTYAHIVIDDEHERLYVQYWFWYYFNDWNNTHESDWEMVQIEFDATSVDEALGQEPARIGYAQHGGGETASWGDSKLGRDGDHLLVYPAAGSHGTYYGNETWIGWGENGSGFGCDVTTTPSRSVPLNVVLVPDDPDPNEAFGWLTFGGRWGQREASEWNGPKGPTSGKKWVDPYAVFESWRETSLKVPASNTIGPSATDLFCTLSEGGSQLVGRMISRPWLIVLTFVGAIAAIVALFVIKRRTLSEAFGLYRAHWRLFGGIGLFTIPIGIVFNGFAILVRDNPPVDWAMEWLNDTAGARLSAALAVGGVQQIAMLMLVAPPVIQAIKDLETGQPASIRRSFTRGFRHWPALALSLLIIVACLSVLVLLLIGIPIAIWLSVSWQFSAQAVILDGEPTSVGALRRSRRVVRGHWLAALGDSLLFQVFGLLPGPLVGALLMLLGKATVNFANTFSSVVYALTVPIAVIGLTLSYRRKQRNPQTPAPAEAPAPGDLRAEPLPG
jgi:hypothetical protein